MEVSVQNQFQGQYLIGVSKEKGKQWTMGFPVKKLYIIIDQ